MLPQSLVIRQQAQEMGLQRLWMGMVALLLGSAQQTRERKAIQQYKMPCLPEGRVPVMRGLPLRSMDSTLAK